ncbi:zinc ribbon domain-containing protein [Ruminococcus sp. NK3A76]|uniref:zinc ribbon domain-containing protein n=1 Tax=Ruminococcus sp. NK3A76 TaxID=877411 RepID=UPI00048D1CAB|nr:zinc ribbon domain-containing protein [Ruminococcus sp. NK3A76]
MAFCRNCGAEQPNNAIVCLSCGCALSPKAAPQSKAGGELVRPQTSKSFKIIVIAFVVILAGLIGITVIYHVSDPERYATNCCEDYLKNVKEKNKGSAMKFSNSQPKLLDSTGNIYYFYVETSSTVMSSTINSGAIIVIRVDGMIKANDYTHIADVPLGDTDKSKLDDQLKIVKQMYDNQSTK